MLIEQLASGETDVPNASDSDGLAFTTQTWVLVKIMHIKIATFVMVRFSEIVQTGNNHCAIGCRESWFSLIANQMGKQNTCMHAKYMTLTILVTQRMIKLKF